MRFFIFNALRGLLFFRKQLANKFWQWYHIYYCQVNNVIFTDKKSVRFNSKSIISISPKSDVWIGKAFFCNSGPDSGIGTTPTKISVAAGSTLKIGDYTGISSTTILVKNSIVIGNHVNIGGGSFLTDSNHHSINWQDREDRKLDVQKAKSAPIIIGDYVFIGARSMILKGVTIGEKSIIAAGSVVVKDIPSNCIAGGNPCKIIKKLND